MRNGELQLGKHQQCVDECTQALNLDENYLKALMRRASSYMELEQFEEAVYDYEKICKLNRTPGNPLIKRIAVINVNN